ncbi:VOC family protein [Amycolatopsis xylanica]|nr:VOC family protein [Amycolatopsis xylanica]
MDIDYLDHTVVLNTDLDAAAERFAALGFLLSPPSAHRLSEQLNGPIATYTCTANRCAVFGESFIELLGIVDENAPDPWHVKELAKSHPGLLLTFGTGDAELVERRWRAAGFPSTGVRSLERDVETADGTRTVRARGVYLGAESTLGVGIQAGQHLTPQYIHQPRLLDHPNGAVGLHSVLLVVPDDAVDSFVERYSLILATGSHVDGPKRVWSLRSGRFEIVGASALPEVLPGEHVPALPCIAAQTVAVADLGLARKLIEDNGIVTREMPAGFFVPAAAALGACVGFVAA